MIKSSALLASLVLASSLTACGVQATSGYQGRPGHWAGVDLAGRVVGTRSSGAYGGADLVLAKPRGEDVSVRHVLVTGGYRWRASRFSFELGPELGAGQPTTLPWHGTGLYVGGASTVLYRLFGDQDDKVGYSVVSVLIDLVAFARGGVWARPVGDSRSEAGDYSLQFGVRISGISDIPVSSNRNWNP